MSWAHPQGFTQAQRLADRFRSTKEVQDCQVLLSSPVLRAQQTAEVLADVLSVGPVEQDPDLCELRPGAADGLAWDDYRRTYGAFDLLSAPTRPFAPGGESWLEFLTRVRATLERLATRFAGQTVVAVTHAGFIVASLLMLFDIPRPGTGARLDPEETSLDQRGVWRKCTGSLPDSMTRRTSSICTQPRSQDRDEARPAAARPPIGFWLFLSRVYCALLRAPKGSLVLGL